MRSKRWQRARARFKEAKVQGEVVTFPGGKAPKAPALNALEESRQRLRDLLMTIKANALLCTQSRLRGFCVFGDASSGKTTATLSAIKDSVPSVVSRLRWGDLPDDIPGRRVQCDGEGNRRYREPFTHITGHLTEAALYEELFAHCEAGEGIIIDDVDIWRPGLVHMLLPILEIGPRAMLPTVAWRSTRRPDGLPASFPFAGYVIILTNRDLESLRRDKSIMGRLVDALLSRINAIDMRLAPHERPILASDLAAQALPKMGLTPAQIADVMSFFAEHVALGDLIEVSIRSIINIANYRIIADDTNIEGYDWRRQAAFTACKKQP